MRKKKRKYGNQAYKHISDLLKEAKVQHKKDFKGKDHEQSWKSFKGNGLEKLIKHVIADEIHQLKLELISGRLLEKTHESKLSDVLFKVKRNLLIDFGEFGYHLPDIDIVIFQPRTSKVIAILSSKVTLRERIAQTGYWKLKLQSTKNAKHIKVYFITLDEDNTLTINDKTKVKKGRAIVEIDLDGSYVLSKAYVKESKKVKLFDKFIEDLRKLI